MKSYFAYIRVSTVKQGEGVSLQEQRGAIEEFAKRRDFPISAWFEERITAAKHGRPVFGKMVSLLKSRKAAGLIIHKIDRSARNLRDWADIGELMDRGVEIHFAHESIDMHSRGGRLSADIMAVVASDYIRNLREETLKGFYGRLKQGFYPLGAPIGYLNNGGGKPKSIDPISGPLVKLGFELYASRQHSLRTLEEALFIKGLRNTKGHIVRLNQLAQMLRNPFYIGIIHIRKSNETFSGIHTPLISSALFNKVQWVLDGKRSQWRQRHTFLFSRRIRCSSCKYSLIGELQKKHIYYRCHTNSCPKTSWREDRIIGIILTTLESLKLSSEEREFKAKAVEEFNKQSSEASAASRRNLQLELENVKSSIDTLLRHYLSKEIL